jgi:hypothetical protein
MKLSRDLYTFLTAIACTLLLGLIASADARMNMRCRVVVPKEYRKPTPKPPPNGESEPVRYKVAYEAFWWNCAAVRAENIHGRCPFMASGNPSSVRRGEGWRVGRRLPDRAVAPNARRIRGAELPAIDSIYSQSERKNASVFRQTNT